MIQSAEPYSKGFRSQHRRTIAKHSHAVNIFFLIIFRMGASNSRSTLISLYSDIYHIEYGKNIISKSYAIALSLNNDTCHIAYGIAIPAPHFPFSVHRSKMRFTPKYANVIISPRQSKHDSGKPRAKIIASRLQYVLFLLRLISSDKTSMK